MQSPILLRDVIEEKFESPAVKEQVREMQSEGQVVIDNESRELLGVHHTGFTCARVAPSLPSGTSYLTALVRG